MAKLDPITVSALKMLRLDTDRVPRNHNDLAFAARRRTKFKVWTQEQTDAYPAPVGSHRPAAGAAGSVIARNAVKEALWHCH